MVKESYVKLRCTKNFKADIELLAKRENRNTSNYIENLLKKEIEKMKKTGNEILRKAESINQFGTNLPQLEIGDIVTLSDVWDGEGEAPEDSYSYLLTHDGEDGESNMDIYINYEFDILEGKENVLDTVVKITNIDLV